jgi:hypothetical protein
MERVIRKELKYAGLKMCNFFHEYLWISKYMVTIEKKLLKFGMHDLSNKFYL